MAFPVKKLKVFMLLFMALSFFIFTIVTKSAVGKTFLPKANLYFVLDSPISASSSKISIKAGTNTPANAFDVVFGFNPNTLFLNEINTASSSCDFEIVNEFSNTLGYARLACASLTGIYGTSTLANFEIIKATSTPQTIMFGNNSTVLSADGYGTPLNTRSTGLEI